MLQRHRRPSLTHLTLLGFLALLAVALVSCAGFGGPPTVTLRPDDIQALLQKHFPQERRLLEVLDVTIAAPRTRLLPERNRLAVVLDIEARDRVFGGSRKGRLDFDAALRWEPGDQTVRMTQVRVQDLSLDAADSATRSRAERLGAAVVERLLEDLSLYQLRGEPAARMQQRGVVPTAVTVTSRGVEITFGALPR
jgi:hypothetical protein